MRIPFLLAIFAALPAFAQFSSMSTDYAGQRLLFTTHLSQIGSGQPDYGKLFIAESGGVQPLLIYNYVVEGTGLYGPGLLTNFYDVDGADISSNGQYISVTAARVCQGYTGGLCGDVNQSTVYDTRGQIALTKNGAIFLRRNGKWAMAVDTMIEGGTYFGLYDLSTGAYSPISANDPVSSRFSALADDGTAVISTSYGLAICRTPASIQYVQGTSGVTAVIDAAATVIVWEAYRSGNTSLYTVQTADLTKSVSLGLSGWTDTQPQLSDDGSTIAFLSTLAGANNPQVFVMAIDGTGRRPVTVEPEGIAQAVLSGNGLVVWALTRTGRLLQVEIATGATAQHTPPLAAFLNPNYLVAYGTPGQATSIPASAMPGENVEITVQGQLAPVVTIEPQKVTFQIPSTAYPDPGTATGTVTIRKPNWPAWSGDKQSFFLVLAPVLLASVHQDFRALITAQQPAQPGEIIHFYGTGFGQVTLPVPDGTPAPLAPLSPTVSPVTCGLLNTAGTQTTPAGVLFAGLAPGLIGIYQLDVKLPDQLPAGGSVQVACYAGGGTAKMQVPIL